MSARLLVFPLECGNLFFIQDVQKYRKQRDFFRAAYRMAENDQMRLDLLFCWQYVRRGLWEIDLKTGRILKKTNTFSKKA